MVWRASLYNNHSYVQWTAGELMRKRRRNSKKLGRYCATIIIAVIVGILGIQMYRLKVKSNEYTERVEELEVRLEQEQRRASELENYEVYVNSDAYIEDTAKSKLGMLYDDEIVFREN